ncbi:transglycosylase domain-containing protein [Metabacillus fastidiosus]|uniref:transglycosylase domain-containing protein n=1 Tax=Metabacillus fastidiosus TaxID=1458 RepID=UPI002E1C6F3C|nr:transglycosylase domain-containing protein [Metabacillus fastidiosus]
MRPFFGWFFIIILAPVLIYIGMIAGEEANNVKALDTVLDEKIPISKIQLARNSYIYDQKGNLISEVISEQENRIIISYDNIPEEVKQLYLVSEDQHFFEHIGFDAAGMLRAVFTNIKHQSIEQGGSTITQQLARNVFLSHEQTYNRKLSELLYSYQLERTWTKEEIFETYLNSIYYSNGVYGIATAATYYFGKELKELNLAEMAFISSIPNNPTLYNPLQHFENTKSRQELLLLKLHENELLSKEDYEKEIKAPIKLNVRGQIDHYPDYVTYVHDELNELIAQKEGYSKKINEANEKDRPAIKKQLNERINQITRNGIIIHTALNPSIQQKVTKAINSRLPYESIQGSAVVIDHKSHKIVALSGGKNYKKFDFNRAYQSYHQPGSAIKPLLDYAPYIDTTGATVNSMIDAGKFCKGIYCPKNYSGKNYGHVTLETALKNSYNTPAVRMLNNVGIEKAFSYLKPFNFKKIVKTDYVLPSAIGGFTYGMSPLELTSAYTTFGNNGNFYDNHAIIKVTDLQGNTLYEWGEKPVRVWKESTNDQMRHLLASVVSSGTGKRAAFPAPYIGGKTGTSNSYQDLWFVGLTDKYTAGVWVGKDKNGSIQGIYSSGTHLQIWKQIINN